MMSIHIIMTQALEPARGVSNSPMRGHTAAKEGFESPVASLPVWYPVQWLLKVCQLVISC